jgi:hypothetical protein
MFALPARQKVVDPADTAQEWVAAWDMVPMLMVAQCPVLLQCRVRSR